MQPEEDPWEWLEDQLQQFLDAWDVHLQSSQTDTPSMAEAPTVCRYAVAPPHASELGEGTVGDLSRTLLVELVKADIEYRLLCGAAVSLETYIESHPLLAPVDADLVHHDFRLRQEHGEAVSVDDYCERFSSCAESLRKLLGMDLPEASMAFHAERRAPSFELGDVVSGEFHLTSLLGEGSFAKVYLARQQSLGRMVALKISANRGNEAETLVQLDHPNIVRVHDQRDVPAEGLRLMYMEYAPGGTLHDVVRRLAELDGELPTGQILVEAIRERLEQGGLESSFPASLRESEWPRVVCELGLQLADALEYAHSKGVLHRDIKPANVLLGANAKPKLADFNISFNSQISGVAPAAYFGGSLAYMSPEQLRACGRSDNTTASDLDARSDVYSLAVVLWELLHGRRPFHDSQPTGDWNSMLQQMVERREAGPPRGSWGASLVSRELQQSLRQCLAPNPDDRLASSRELTRELHLCLQPRARALVKPNHHWFGRIALRHPLLILFACLLLPNLLAALLNFLFNREWMEEYTSQEAKSTFFIVQGVINSIAFPLGLFAVGRFFHPIARAVRTRAEGGSVPREQLHQLRRRSLRTGSFGAWVGVALWTVAGVIYPVAIHLWSGAFPWNGYLVFSIDLIACGLIAGSYPFFLATLVALEILYPSLLDLGDIPEDETATLQQLAQRTGAYLLIAAGVPMVALLFLAPLVIAGHSIYQEALIGLVIAGIVGLFAAWRAHQKIQQDLQALCYAVEPIAL